MKLLPPSYRTHGFLHICIKRDRSIYIYEKLDSDTEELRCFEVFKARIRPATQSGLIPNSQDSHRRPSNEDFGYTAFSTFTKDRALKRFEELRLKYYGN